MRAQELYEESHWKNEIPLSMEEAEALARTEQIDEKSQKPHEDTEVLHLGVNNPSFRLPKPLKKS